MLPEGVMLNYLSRRRNPTPFFNFMPPELLMFGEQAMVEALIENPPDWVVMTGRGASEYGYEYLGRGYGERLAGWVRDNYDLFERVDAGPDVPSNAMSWALILKHAPAG